MKIQQGFSLFEMMLVMSIIAIFLAMAFPLLRYPWEQFNQTMLQTQLIQAIQIAKHEARIRHQAIALCKSNSLHQCAGEWIDGQLIFIDEYDDGSVHDQAQILKTIHMPAQGGKLYWRSFPIYRDYLQFSASGLAQNDNGTFWYCDAELTAIWALSLSKSGHTRVIYPDRDGVLRDGSGRVLAC